MTPTRLRTLLLAGVLAAVTGFLVAETAYGDLPPLPLLAPVSLVLLAVVEVGAARVVRDRVHRRAQPGARRLHPLQVARAAALAKASSLAGALLAGLYLGLLAWTLPRAAEQAADDALVAALSALAAALLVGAALLLERACRTPDLPEDDPRLGSTA